LVVAVVALVFVLIAGNLIPASRWTIKPFPEFFLYSNPTMRFPAWLEWKTEGTTVYG